MGFSRTRLAVVLLGDRLCVAVMQGARVHTFTVESEQPAASLRAELDARRVTPRRVAIGLPRSAVTVKPVELPAVGADTREMVRFELERHLPFATDDAAFDFVPLASPETGEATDHVARRVLLAAADRRVVDTALRLAAEMKVRPRSITVAAHDLVSLARPPARGHVVWLHRVEDTMEVLFLAGGGVVMSRAFPAVDDAGLVTEIRRSFGLVKWRGCDAVWISGDMTPPTGPMDSPLADLGAPVSEPAYTATARRALATIDTTPRGALELALAVALGPTDRPLDLLPAAMRPFRLTRGQLMTAGIGSVAALLAIAALMVPGYRDGRRLVKLNTEIAGLDSQVREVERMVKDLEGKRRLVTTVQSLEDGALRPLPVMRELTDLLPNDAWLTLLSLDAKGIELTGQANTASALIPLLENSPRFERVEFASPVTRGRDREQFRIQAVWEAREAAAATPPKTPPKVPPTEVRRPNVPPPSAAAPSTAPPVIAPPPRALPQTDPQLAPPRPAPQAAPTPDPHTTPPPQVLMPPPDRSGTPGTLPVMPRRPTPGESGR
jgi:general secretion pathway protein L